MKRLIEQTVCKPYVDEIVKLKKDLELAKKTLLSYERYKSIDRFRGIPTMEELITSGQAIDKGTTTYLWTRDFHRQTGIQMVEYAKGSIKDKICQYVDLVGSHRWRIPKTIFRELMAIIPVNEWSYMSLDKYNRTFVCADFAVATWSEIQSSPYWDIWFGIALVSPKLHLVNIVWFSDDERFWLFEPQNDTLWPLNPKDEKDIPVRIIV